MAFNQEQDLVEFKKEEEEQMNHTEKEEEVDLSPKSHAYQNYPLRKKWVHDVVLQAEQESYMGGQR